MNRYSCVMHHCSDSRRWILVYPVCSACVVWIPTPFLSLGPLRRIKHESKYIDFHLILMLCSSTPISRDVTCLVTPGNGLLALVVIFSICLIFMITSSYSAWLALCAGNSPVTGEFPPQRSVTRSFDIFFELRQNKRLNKHSGCWWFETPPH